MHELHKLEKVAHEGYTSYNFPKGDLYAVCLPQVYLNSLILSDKCAQQFRKHHTIIPLLRHHQGLLVCQRCHKFGKTGSSHRPWAGMAFPLALSLSVDLTYHRSWRLWPLLWRQFYHISRRRFITPYKVGTRPQGLLSLWRNGHLWSGVINAISE